MNIFTFNELWNVIFVTKQGVFVMYGDKMSATRKDSNHITGTAEPKVVKFCTRVGYINSNNRMTYHQQKGVVMVT